MTEATTTSRFPATVMALVVAVDAAALLALPTLPTMGLERVGTLALLTLLAAVAGMRPVKLGFLDSKITASDPIILATLVLLGPLPAVVAALAALLGCNLGRAQKPRRIHVAFKLHPVLVRDIRIQPDTAARRDVPVGRHRHPRRIGVIGPPAIARRARIRIHQKFVSASFRAGRLAAGTRCRWSEVRIS